MGIINGHDVIIVPGIERDRDVAVRLEENMKMMLGCIGGWEKGMEWRGKAGIHGWIYAYGWKDG